MAEQPDYHLVLRPMPGGDAPPIHRLRRALKVLGRGYGLRCIEAREVARDSNESRTPVANMTTTTEITP